MKTSNFTHVFPSGMQSYSSMICFFGKAQNLNYGSYEKREWAYRRNGFVGLKKCVHSGDDTEAM